MFTLMNRLEKLEKDHGMLGTVFGILLLAISFMSSCFLVYLLVKFNTDLLNFVIKHFWFN